MTDSPTATAASKLGIEDEVFEADVGVPRARARAADGNVLAGPAAVATGAAGGGA
jgi:hypothetical protein